LRRDDPRRALTKLQTCFKDNPRDVATLELLADAFQALGQDQKTLSVLKELAKVLHESGQIGQRAATYKRILGLAPEDDEARLGVGGAQAAGRRPQSTMRTAFAESIPHHEEEISAEIEEEAAPILQPRPVYDETDADSGVDLAAASDQGFASVSDD